MSRPYKTIKNVTVTNSLSDSLSDFNISIDVAFNVSEICLKSYSFHDYNTNADNTFMYLLSSNLVNGPLMSFVNDTSMTSFCHAQFPAMHQPVHGTYNFKFTLVSTVPFAPVTANFKSYVVLHFDFFEYF
jgi:hypothetical protein